MSSVTIAWSGLERSGIHHLHATGLRNWVFGEELPEEDSQFEGGFQVARYGDPLLEECLLGCLEAADDGLKRRRIGVIGHRRTVFQAAFYVD
jgi:hypothetical protein